MRSVYFAPTLLFCPILSCVYLAYLASVVSKNYIDFVQLASNASIMIRQVSEYPSVRHVLDTNTLSKLKCSWFLAHYIEKWLLSHFPYRKNGCWILSFHVYLQVKTVYPLGFYSLLTVPPTLAVMNVFWFWKIARGMIKTLKKARHSKWQVHFLPTSLPCLSCSTLYFILLPTC